MIKTHWIPAVLVTAMLAACGGGGGGDDQVGAPNTPSAVGSSTGVFTDAPVAGLGYVASPSGVRGVTNAAGQFTYNPGDRVTFTVGGLQLGVADGAANVTPADIGGNPDVVTNLLVLLQSLDTDSSPDTITLPANLSATTLSTVNLTQAPADFADPAKNTVLAAALPAGGSIVGPEAAKQHAIDYFWSQAQGVWRIAAVGEDGESFMRIHLSDIDLNPDTPRVPTYVLGDLGEADNEEGGPGVEVGTLQWDPLTSKLTAVATHDHNGDWGLSAPGEMTLKLDGGKLLFTDKLSDTDVFTAALTRVVNDPAGLTGAWLFIDPEVGERLRSIIFVFTADNRYVMIDPLGDTDSSLPDDPPCGGPGVEDGRFTNSGGVLTVTSVTQDTNGCAGLNDGGGNGMAALSFALNAEGMLEFSEEGTVVATFKRVSK